MQCTHLSGAPTRQAVLKHQTVTRTVPGSTLRHERSVGLSKTYMSSLSRKASLSNGRAPSFLRSRALRPVVSATDSSQQEQVKSVKAHDWEAEWQNARKLHAEGAVIDTTIEMSNRGGVIVRVGRLKGFVPASQLDPERLPAEDAGGVMLMDRLATLVGQPIQLKVLIVEPEKRQFVLSERAVIRGSSMNGLSEGMVMKGVVRSFADYGAFLDLVDESSSTRSGAEGMIHISELSWGRVMHPSEVLEIGQEIDVKIIRIDRQRSRISLSLRELQEDPLLETLDTLMPVQSFDESFDEPELKGDEQITLGGLSEICKELLDVDGIQAVVPGRQATEAHVVSQDLEIWLTNVVVKDGYNLLARAGNRVQEVHVVTDLERDQIKQQLKSILSRVA